MSGFYDNLFLVLILYWRLAPTFIHATLRRNLVNGRGLDNPHASNQLVLLLSRYSCYCCSFLSVSSAFHYFVLKLATINCIEIFNYTWVILFLFSVCFMFFISCCLVAYNGITLYYDMFSVFLTFDYFQGVIFLHL